MPIDREKLAQNQEAARDMFAANMVLQQAINQHRKEQTPESEAAVKLAQEEADRLTIAFRESTDPRQALIGMVFLGLLILVPVILWIVFK